MDQNLSENCLGSQVGPGADLGILLFVFDRFWLIWMSCLVRFFIDIGEFLIDFETIFKQMLGLYFLGSSFWVSAA